MCGVPALTDMDFFTTYDMVCRTSWRTCWFRPLGKHGLVTKHNGEMQVLYCKHPYIHSRLYDFHFFPKVHKHYYNFNLKLNEVWDGSYKHLAQTLELVQSFCEG